MKIAIVHYWLVTMRGGEKVLEQICRIFPEADIFTHVVDFEAISETLKSHQIRTTFIGKLPGARKYYKTYLPLMPAALEQLDLRGYDLVISSESGPSKGVITGSDTLHICYCHTPMRYLWNMHHDYRDGAGLMNRAAMDWMFGRLRQWDYVSAGRVDHFVANSTTVAKRIAKFYRRPSEVIHPPVNIENFALQPQADYYLYCGQLVAYKRADLAVEAFNRLGKPLLIVGEGEELSRLKSIARPNIRFLKRQSSAELAHIYAVCQALIFPGEEDFGIVPVEVMAAGRPVIGFDKGGIQDTVQDGINGILFQEQTVDGLVAAIARFEQCKDRFLPSEISATVARFSATRFRSEFEAFVDRKFSEFKKNGPPLL